MRTPVLVLAAVLPLLALAPAEAQKLDVGKWTGRVTPPGESVATEVTYDVTLKGDTIGITIDAGQHGSFVANEVKLGEKGLTFWFAPGPRVACVLAQREDRTFEGDCMDEGGGVAHMVMVPPKKE